VYAILIAGNTDNIAGITGNNWFRNSGFQNKWFRQDLEVPAISLRQAVGEIDELCSHS